MAPAYQHFVVVFNKTGTGEVIKFRTDAGHTRIMKLQQPVKEEWSRLFRLRDFGVAVVDNKAYFIGGYDKHKDICTNKCISFNPKTHQWKKLAPMMTARDKFAIATIAKKIIVAGGEKSAGKFTTESEIYDTETDQWEKAGLLPKWRTHSSACTIGDAVYMSGGYMGLKPKNNIWMNERVQNWVELDEDCPQMLTAPTVKHCMVAVDDKIYFLGGQRLQKSVDRSAPKLVTSGVTEALTVYIRTGLDPELAITPRANTGLADNADSDAEDLEAAELGPDPFRQRADVICPWDLKPTLPDMVHARHGAGAVLLGRRIYVFGGVKAAGGDCTQVEYLDVDTRTWHTAGTILGGNVSSVTAAVLVFARPEDAAFELALEKRKAKECELGLADADSTHKYRWILW